MKKIVLALVFIMGFIFMGHSQSLSENAIGLRFGGGNGYGAEASYQRLLGGNNRLELDLGFRNEHHYHDFKLTALYQWVWNIDRGFYWYAGVGGGIGSVSIKHHEYDDDDGFFAFLAGDIGIEYDFNIPLQVFIDFRPEFFFTSYEYYDDFGPDFAIGLRYRF